MRDMEAKDERKFFGVEVMLGHMRILWTTMFIESI